MATPGPRPAFDEGIELAGPHWMSFRGQRECVHVVCVHVCVWWCVHVCVCAVWCAHVPVVCVQTQAVYMFVNLNYKAQGNCSAQGC